MRCTDMLRKIIATATLLALPATALAATTVPASAEAGEAERHGRCAGGAYELSVDREDGRYEVGVDLDRVAPGSRWTIAVRHDGKRVTRVTRVADREGDLDVVTVRRGTAGSETFAFTAKRVGGTQRCSASVTIP
jgi:hypothetical protein